MNEVVNMWKKRTVTGKKLGTSFVLSGNKKHKYSYHNSIGLNKLTSLSWLMLQHWCKCKLYNAYDWFQIYKVKNVTEAVFNIDSLSIFTQWVNKHQILLQLSQAVLSKNVMLCMINVSTTMTTKEIESLCILSILPHSVPTVFLTINVLDNVGVYWLFYCIQYTHKLQFGCFICS